MEGLDASAYSQLLNDILESVGAARLEAARQLNSQQIALNFEIGRKIVTNQEKYGWGKSVVNSLARDLQDQTGGKKGFSPQNLWNMRLFFLEYEHHEGLLEKAREIPWGHNLVIMQKVKNDQEREFYLEATRNYGWSRAVLLNQIKGKAFERDKISPKQTNYDQVLPAHLAEQANQALKSEYNLDFLGLTGPVFERDLEESLVAKLRDLILELGYGFCFIGNQYPLKLGDRQYRVDLLFYHRILKCLVAVDLKTVRFEPEFAGKMAFYLELLDMQEKQEDDQPSIGIVLCPEKNELVVEYALKVSRMPVGVIEYSLVKDLPPKLAGMLPSSSDVKKLLDGKNAA